MLINQMPSKYHVFRDHMVRAGATNGDWITAPMVLPLLQSATNA